jgi:dihydrofolate reductase
MGRNMFGPIRGEWGDTDWRGWWGEDPPYHHPVFVLTHHAHDPIEMDGGTTFHFVTDGIEAALVRATAAAGGDDIRLGGGVATIQEYLRAGLVDDLHVAIVPILLGRGERLFENLGDAVDGYECAALVSSPSVAATCEWCRRANAGRPRGAHVGAVWHGGASSRRRSSPTDSGPTSCWPSLAARHRRRRFARARREELLRDERGVLQASTSGSRCRWCCRRRSTRSTSAGCVLIADDVADTARRSSS